MYGWLIAAAVIGVVVYLGRRARSRRENTSDGEAATIIHGYLHGGRGGGWEWGEFVDRPFRNPRLERLRRLCKEAESKLPAEREAVLDEIVAKLRTGQFN
jgi:hypothetical protein